MTYRLALVFFLLTAMPARAAVAQLVDVREADREMFPAAVTYDSSLPTPADFLGFELGTQPVRHHQLVDYIRSIAEASDRMTIEVIGYSHERRPILFLTVTSPGNHANIDRIRSAHASLSEAGGNGESPDDMPVITWINYGVHGAESSGMDAALPFVYHLAAATGQDIEDQLEKSVILVTAVFNPDGHAKRIGWFDSWGGAQPIANPGHIEHQFNWQYARTNHYFFDLNRQWLLLTQPEARAWMRKWHEWRPNLTVDYHEMGSDQTYYFHPGVASRTNPLVPEEAERLMEQTARVSERFLDTEGRLYYHGESFDNFYVGKGSTFPLVNGGVGILYEAAAALGREIATPNGLRTYRENIRKHFRTSIASVEAAVALRGDLLAYQKQFYDGALDAAGEHATKAWIVAAPGDPARLNLFVDLLRFHRIEAYVLARDVDVDGQRFGAGNAVVVPAAQAQHRLIRSIFEPQTEFEDNTFYDVSTWTLPPAFGLRFAGLEGRSYRTALLGERYVPVPPVHSQPDTSSYGYVFDWAGYYAPRALDRLLRQDILVRVATKPFGASTTRGDLEFGAGSIVIPFDRQPVDPATIHTLVTEIAAEDGLQVHALSSGRSTDGTAGIDIGGPSFRGITRPEVLLVVGDDVDLYEAGEAWHLLDWRMRMPVTLRARDSLGETDWDRYTHIVFTAGEFEEYEADYQERLRQWVGEGGTVIAMRNAVPWIRALTVDWVDPEVGASGPATASAGEPGLEQIAGDASGDDKQDRVPYGDKDRVEALDLIGGAILAADLDTTHPLGFGYDRRDIYVHKNYREPMPPAKTRFGTVIEYAEEPVYSGYVSDGNAAALAGTPALIAERWKQGTVVLFADNPNFRGYWYGTNKLFLNALFFSSIIDPPLDE
jgi:hypothetical protein